METKPEVKLGKLELNDNSELSLTADEFTQLGTEILTKDKTSGEVMLSSVTNAPIGLDLLLVGLAKGQSLEISRLYKAMSKLEGQIFDDENLKDISVDKKIEFYRLAKESFQFRVSFIRDTQARVNWNKLGADLLSLNAQYAKNEIENKEDDVTTSTKKTMKQVLKQIITKEYTLTKTKK